MYQRGGSVGVLYLIACETIRSANMKQRYYHQLVVQYAHKKDDKSLEWISAFLQKYWFLAETKILRIGRTAADSNMSDFLDLTLFACEAMVVADFPPTV